MRSAGHMVCAFAGSAFALASAGQVEVAAQGVPPRNSAETVIEQRKGPVQQRREALGPSGTEVGAGFVGRLLIGRDGRPIAYIDGVEVAPDGTLSAVTFDIGTVLRMGPRRVALPVRQIAEEDGRLVASVSVDEATRLPGYIGPSRMSPPFRDGTVVR